MACQSFNFGFMRITPENFKDVIIQMENSTFPIVEKITNSSCKANE